jgi:hypothetical protein
MRRFGELADTYLKPKECIQINANCSRIARIQKQSQYNFKDALILHCGDFVDEDAAYQTWTIHYFQQRQQ